MPLISDDPKSVSKGDKTMYQSLKRRLKLLICENENYQEELRKCQKELLIINRDKYFLMDKLMKYEKLSSSDSDPEVTDSSESEKEVKQERTTKTRRRRLESTISETTGGTSTASTNATTKRKRTTNNGTTATNIPPPPSSSSSSSPSLITYSSYRNKKSNNDRTKCVNKTTISVPPSTSLTPLKSASSFPSSPSVSSKAKATAVPPTVPSILSATLTAATITASLPTITPTTVGFASSALKIALSQPITNSSSSSSLSSSSSSHINTINTSSNQQTLPPPSTPLSIPSSPLIPLTITPTPTIALPRPPPTKTETTPSILSLERANGGQLTSEEIERHLESRSIQPSLLLPEKTPLTVPIELFSNESPNESTNPETKSD